MGMVFTDLCNEIKLRYSASTPSYISMTPDDQAHLVVQGSTCLLVHKRLQHLVVAGYHLPESNKLRTRC